MADAALAKATRRAHVPAIHPRSLLWLYQATDRPLIAPACRQERSVAQTPMSTSHAAFGATSVPAPQPLAPEQRSPAGVSTVSAHVARARARPDARTDRQAGGKMHRCTRARAHAPPEVGSRRRSRNEASRCRHSGPPPRTSSTLRRTAARSRRPICPKIRSLSRAPVRLRVATTPTAECLLRGFGRAAARAPAHVAAPRELRTEVYADADARRPARLPRISGTCWSTVPISDRIRTPPTE